MLVGAPQTIFTPISSSAEYIGSQIYFEAVPPGIDIPMGYAATGGLGALFEYSPFASPSSPQTLASLTDDASANNSAHSGSLPLPTTTAFSLLHTRIGDAGLAMHPFVEQLLSTSPASVGAKGGEGGGGIGETILSLDLSYCALTASAFDTILAIMGRLPNLQKLYLTGNTFSLPMKVTVGTMALNQPQPLDVDNAGSITVAENGGGSSITPPTPASPSSAVTDPQQSSVAAEASVISLDDFVDTLCTHWEAHPSLSTLVLDPWITSGHVRFRAIRQQRVSLQRWQALTSTLGVTGFNEAEYVKLATAQKRAAATVEEGSSGRKVGRGGGLSLDPDTLMPSSRGRRSKRRDLLDDDEDDDEDKPFANFTRSQVNTVLADLLPIKHHNRKQFLKEALTQLLVNETYRREILRSEEIAAFRTLSGKAEASADAARNGFTAASRASVRMMSYSLLQDEGVSEIARVNSNSNQSAAADKEKAALLSKLLRAHERQIHKFAKFEAQLRFENERAEEAIRERIVKDRAAAKADLTRRQNGKK